MEEINETVEDFDILIEMMLNMAESYQYLDEYKILIVENCNEPFIVMNMEQFKELEKKVIVR